MYRTPNKSQHDGLYNVTSHAFPFRFCRGSSFCLYTLVANLQSQSATKHPPHPRERLTPRRLTD